MSNTIKTKRQKHTNLRFTCALLRAQGSNYWLDDSFFDRLFVGSPQSICQIAFLSLHESLVPSSQIFWGEVELGIIHSFVAPNAAHGLTVRMIIDEEVDSLGIGHSLVSLLDLVILLHGQIENDMPVLLLVDLKPFFDQHQSDAAAVC